MYRLIVSSLLLMWAFFTPVQAQTSAEAAAEPIYIESDRLEIDEARGLSIYRGNVHFRQATTHVWADEVMVYVDDQQTVEKIEAEGRPARFHQYPAVDVEELQGEALSIVYRAAEGFVVLEGDASLMQEKNKFAGNRIEYDADKRVVRAGQQEPGESGRVQVVIQPRAKTPPQPDVDAPSDVNNQPDGDVQP